MIQALLFLFASLPIFIILTETVKFRLIINETETLQIHFTIFALYLERTKDKKVQSKGKGKRNRKRSTKLHSFLGRLIPAAEVEISRLAVLLPSSDPSEAALRRASALSLLSSAFALLQNRARNFLIGDITVEPSDNNNLKAILDLSITVSLVRILTASAALIKKHGD